jgi:hypothetical protein
MGLTDKEKAVLDFEASWWQEGGPKEVRIREQLELSPTRFYAILQELMESAEAMEYNPLVVRRMRRMRERRRRARYEGRSVAYRGNTNPPADGPRPR